MWTETTPRERPAVRSRTPAGRPRGIPIELLALWLVLAGLAACDASSPSESLVVGDTVQRVDTVLRPDSVILVGAGEIAGAPIEGAEATARILDSLVALDPATVVYTTGDNALPDAQPEEFERFYEPTWGRHRARTRPSPGSNDYDPGNAYFAYFGDRAGPHGRGYYSYDVGRTWQVVSLTSWRDVSASRGSHQEEWLRRELADAKTRGRPCTIAYWHAPRWSSGRVHGSSTKMKEMVEALHDFGAEVILSGHEHVYERFAELDPEGRPEPERGIRHFTVGTGGFELHEFGDPLPSSEVRYNDTFGVLALTLFDSSYRWEFIPVAGDFVDTGTEACR